MTLVQHQGKSIEFYTPPEVIEAARRTLGRIDFDPCSCALAQTTVKADDWIGLPTDGLDAPWPAGARVLVNPPGGTSRTTKARAATMTTAQAERWGTTSTAAAWWRRACMHTRTRGGALVFVGFNLEIVRTARAHGAICDTGPLDWTYVIPDERLAFWREGAGSELEPAGQPSHANVIVCVGHSDVRMRFAREFSIFGRVRNVG